MGWTIEQWAGLGVRPDGEPMSAEEMARKDDCTCWAPDDAEPEDHDEDCPEHPDGDDTE